MTDLLFLVPRLYSQTTKILMECARQMKISFDVSFLEHVKLVIKGDNVSIFDNGRDISKPGYVLPRIDGKRKNEGHKILTAYELNNVRKPYPADVINIVHDKFLTSLYLAKKGIPVPFTIYTRSISKIESLDFNYPIILKLLSGSGGKGVMFIDSEESLRELVGTLNVEEKAEFLIQEYLRVEHPYDIRILVVGGRIIGAMKRIAKQGEIRANVKVGGRVESYAPTQEEEEIAIKSLEVLRIDIGAVDIITLPNGESYVIELNLNPGIQGLMKATGKDIGKEIMLYVKEQIRR